MTFFVIAILAVLMIALSSNLQSLYTGVLRPRTLQSTKNAIIAGVVLIVWGFVVLIG
jgi:hypothetical protein